MADVLYETKPSPTPEGILGQDAEARVDPFSGQTIIYAPERSGRPIDFHVAQLPVNNAMGCPFCAGQESSTPSSVWVGRLGVGAVGHLQTASLSSGKLSVPHDNWTVRVVPNKFPAIREIRDHDCLDSAKSNAGNGAVARLFQSAKIYGGHDVVIESPDHVSSFSELSFANCELVLAAYQARIAHWSAIPGIKYLSVFKNVGAQAGASLIHSHSQIIATTQLPADVERRCNNVAKYHAQVGSCMQCDVIRAESKQRVRIVAESEDVIAYCPFASAMPMTVRITTKKHIDRFNLLNEDQLASVTHMLRRTLSWLERLCNGVAYNIVLNTRPPGISSASEAHHWSLDLTPRINRIAGFELGSGCMINQVLPENAASQYRQFVQGSTSGW